MFLPLNLPAIIGGASRTSWLCLWTKPKRLMIRTRRVDHSSNQTGKYVCGNSLLCGHGPMSGSEHRAVTTQGSILLQHRQVEESGRTAQLQQILSGRNEYLGEVPALLVCQPVPTFSSPLPLVPPLPAALALIKTPKLSTDSLQEPLPIAAAGDTATQPGDQRETMRSLLLFTILAALAVAVLCYGERTFLPALPLGFCAWLLLLFVFSPNPLLIFSLSLLRSQRCHAFHFSQCPLTLICPILLF